MNLRKLFKRDPLFRYDPIIGKALKNKKSAPEQESAPSAEPPAPSVLPNTQQYLNSPASAPRATDYSVYMKPLIIGGIAIASILFYFRR